MVETSIPKLQLIINYFTLHSES